MAGAAILYGAYTVVFLKPYFKVTSIEVKGELNELSPEEVVSISGINIGDHILRIPVEDIQNKLLANPWAKEVAVHRKLPHMVLIYLKEYKPEAIVKRGDWYYVNRLGKMFKTLSKEDDRDYIFITGLERIENDDAFRSKVIELLRLKELYESTMIGEIYAISEIHLDKNRGVSIITRNDPMEIRLGYGPFMEKLDRLQLVYPKIKTHGGVVAYIDVNSQGKVVVKYGT